MQIERYCQPYDSSPYQTHGSTDGMMCTQDEDCALTYDSAGYWCEGGGALQIGTCEACPAGCPIGGGCNACNNDASVMECGRSDTLEKFTCAASVAAAAFTDFFSCAGTRAVRWSHTIEFNVQKVSYSTPSLLPQDMTWLLARPMRSQTRSLVGRAETVTFPSAVSRPRRSTLSCAAESD